MQSPELDNRAVDENFMAEIVDRTRGRKIWLFEHFFFVKAHLFRRLQQNQHVPRSAWRNQFVGDFGAERPEQVEMSDEKGQMRVVRHRIERVDLQRKMSPVFEELPHHREWQLAIAELDHESAFINLFVCRSEEHTS